MSAAKAKAPASDISRDQLLRFYRQMVAIRLFEERVNDLYTRALMPGLAHLYIGEEAIATGIMGSLGPDDAVVATYREHGHALARGMDPGRVMAEMYGKVEGCSRGRGGSMHLFDAGTSCKIPTVK